MINVCFHGENWRFIELKKHLLGINAIVALTSVGRTLI